ncbi:MAG TPA: hypothetical protein VFH80_27530, partial [Solirubrobacteraceae bacterium]|nr:hypothetical protein [Solirubrobacteraceae bacterium]
MSETGKTLARAIRFAAAVVLPALALSGGASARAPGRAADLVEARVGTPPARVLPGASFQLHDTVTNRGRALAGRSVTRYYLRSAQASMLIGARPVPALRPGQR